MQRGDAGGEHRPSFGARRIAMANAAIDGRGNWRYVIGRLPGYESRRNLHRAAMAGRTGGDRHLRVIEDRRCPVGCLRADAGGMAVLARIGGGHVIALLAHRFGAVVAAHAVRGNTGVVEARAQPVVRQMAIAALEIGGNVVRRLAGGLRSVVANDAKAGDRQRNLRMIDAGGRIPGKHRVAGGAVLTGCRMRRALSLGDYAVVASGAAAHYLAMVEVHVGTERDGVMAGGAVVAARDMRGGLGRRVVR